MISLSVLSSITSARRANSWRTDRMLEALHPTIAQSDVKCCKVITIHHIIFCSMLYGADIYLLRIPMHQTVHFAEIRSLWRSHQTDKWRRQSGESSASSVIQTCTSVRFAFSCSLFTFTVVTVESSDLRNVRWSAWRTVEPQDGLCFFLFFWGVSTWWRIFKVKSAP